MLDEETLRYFQQRLREVVAGSDEDISQLADIISDLLLELLE